MDDTVHRSQDAEHFEDSFLHELYLNATLLPFRSENDHQCICINTRNSSRAFINTLEAYISAHPNYLRLVVRGLDYYLEVLDSGTFVEAYENGVFMETN